MKIFKKRFCNHQWKSHAKKDYTYEYSFSKEIYKHTTEEVLICIVCGKIKQIEY